jgi:MerR family transcriptional regulator, light-induced transcriptional regulator
METYQIDQLEQMTGIKAHTIRIWEKRYGIICPDRTSTNRRSYSEGQVRKLLNVATLLARGQKISKIANLTEDELNSLIDTPDNTELKDSICAGYINDLIKSMLDFNEAGFEKVFSAATTRLGFYDAIVNVIYPFLNKVGILWNISKTTPIQEHFATCIIKRKLMSATDGLLPPTKKTKKFLLFLPPDEWHEIGLLFANYIIRSKGFETIYLGQNVPIENIENIVNSTHPKYILLFFISLRSPEDVQETIKRLSKTDENITLFVAGNSLLIPENKNDFKNTFFLTGASSLIKFLE